MGNSKLRAAEDRGDENGERVHGGCVIGCSMMMLRLIGLGCSPGASKKVLETFMSLRF